MGCDIHSYAEKKTGDGYEMIADLRPFDWRSYSLYGFLADVRNYSAIPPIAPRRGLPDDASKAVLIKAESWSGDGHSHSWLSLRELVDFNYDQQIEDRRFTRKMAEGYWSGGQTCDPGEGEKMTLRDFLGDDFFRDLNELKEAGADRVVFWFDN